jgi:hypothetical protein
MYKTGRAVEDEYDVVSTVWRTGDYVSNTMSST